MKTEAGARSMVSDEAEWHDEAEHRSGVRSSGFSSQARDLPKRDLPKQVA
jgi:hypothetical protein